LDHQSEEDLKLSLSLICIIFECRSIAIPPLFFSLIRFSFDLFTLYFNPSVRHTSSLSASVERNL